MNHTLNASKRSWSMCVTFVHLFSWCFRDKPAWQARDLLVWFTCAEGYLKFGLMVEMTDADRLAIN